MQKHFLYFYIIWNTISVVIRASLSQFAKNQVEFSEVFILFWDPTFTLWFMYAMFWALGLVYILNKLQTFEQIAITLIVVTIVQATNIGLPFFLSQLISYFPLLLIGMLFSDYWKNLFIKPSFTYQWFIVFVTCIVGIVLVRIEYIDKKAGDFYYPLTVLASLSVIYLMSMFRHSKIVYLFAYIGERSLYIYLMHSIPVAAFRHILMKLGMDEYPELAILLSSFLIIACSLLIHNVLKDVKGIKYLFTRPSFLILKN
jgi:surface polysaccharide O-acyltransferase-like enzyme